MDKVTIGMGWFWATICLLWAFGLHDMLKSKLAPMPAPSIMRVPWYVLVSFILAASIGISGFLFIASGGPWVNQHATLISFVVYGYLAAAIMLFLISGVRYIHVMRKHDWFRKRQHL